MDITGIILAGGKSSRMGQDKGLLLLNNKPLVQHIIEALKPITSNIIIIANNDDYKSFGYTVYNDIIKEKGPVGGIYTALSYTSTLNNIVISCDTPFVTTELLEFLLSKSKNNLVTIPSFNNKTHPLIGVYKQTGITAFKNALDDNDPNVFKLKLMLVNQSLNCNIVNVDKAFNNEKLFYNINTPTDLKQAQNEN